MRTNTKTPPMRRSSSDRTYIIPIVLEQPGQTNELEQIADEAIQALAGQLQESRKLVQLIHEELGFAEWATPEHAEQILRELIDKYWPLTKDGDK